MSRPKQPAERALSHRILRLRLLAQDADAATMTIWEAYAARARARAVLADPTMEDAHELARKVMCHPAMQHLPPIDDAPARTRNVIDPLPAWVARRRWRDSGH